MPNCHAFHSGSDFIPYNISADLETSVNQKLIQFLINDPIATVFDQARSPIPMPTRLRSFQSAVVHPVDVGEDTILVLQHG